MSNSRRVKLKVNKSSKKSKTKKTDVVSTVKKVLNAERNKQATNPNVIRLKAATSVRSGVLDMGEAFRRALANPFDPAVAGVKLPEPFPVHTDTYKVAGSIQVSSAVSVLSGGLYLRSNPFYALLNTSLYTSASQSLTIGGSPIAFGGTTSAYSAVAPPGVMRNYRVVACGFKISCTQPWNQREGNMYVAPIPNGKDTLSYNLLNNQGVLYSSCPSRLTDDIDAKSLASSQILELPGAMRFSLSELGNSCIILSDRPTSWDYASFYPTSETVAINATLSDATDIVVVTATGAGSPANSASIPITLSPGHTSYAVYFDQIPNQAQNLVNIEYIYHLEGSPTIAISGSNPVMVPTGPEMPSRATDWTKVMRGVSRFGVGVANVATEYGPEIARAYQYFTGANGVGPFRTIGMD